MLITNTTTGAIEQLRYDVNGHDRLPAIINDSRGLVVRNRETGQYEGPAEEIAFWRAWVLGSKAADQLEQELDNCCKDWRALVDGGELDDQPSARTALAT